MDGFPRTGHRWVANRNVTLKKCRRILEQDLGMKEKKLDEVKKDVHELIDRVLMDGMQPDPIETGPVETKGRGKEKQGTKRRNAGSETKTKHSTQPKTQKGARKERSNVEEKTGNTRSARVEKLKRILKQATITISPSIYVKHKEENELYEALCGLLRKEGLPPNPTDREISSVRKRKQTERDLDGIDTSNIISSGRRRQRTTDARYNYKEEDESDEDVGESSPEPSEQHAVDDSDGSEPIDEEKSSEAPLYEPPHAQKQARGTQEDADEDARPPKRRAMLISDEDE